MFAFFSQAIEKKKKYIWEKIKAQVWQTFISINSKETPKSDYTLFPWKISKN